MSNARPAIEVTGLAKRYVIEHESRHDNLRDTLHHAARKLWRRARWGTGFEREEFWALRDVSFSVPPGEVVGVIGRNGAGKSTLLKILSRITEPTAGRVTLRGRVASLLEVGTGFHPDLTGRENIFLNGAILGMSRAEIRSKFDEIVAFAEIEKFLDTPVKRYSSGMYVRLAFAVAAHLEPEILIVDEVLAVGDAQFQKKCLGKMRSVAREGGRTVLFVSHNLGAIRELCTRGLLLQAGRVELAGSTREVLQRYHDVESAREETSAAVGRRSDDGSVELLDARLETTDGRPVIETAVGETWCMRIDFATHRPFTDFRAALGLVGEDGAPIQTAWSPMRTLSPGKHTIRFTQQATLAAGSYRMLAGFSAGDRTLLQTGCGELHLSGGDPARFPATSGVGTVLNTMNIEFVLS